MLHVESEARLIVGLAVPYGPAARLRSRRRRFAPGWWTSPPRVWLCEEHSRSARRGEVTALKDTPVGLLAVIKVRPGSAGDRILIRAAQGAYGLSVGFDMITEIPDPEELSVRIVTAGLLTEISVTPDPAFGGV